jgi:aldose 1-epimerase
VRRAWLPLIIGAIVSAADYAAERIQVEGHEVIRLADLGRQIEVRVAPWMGNNAYEMKVKGRPILWAPFTTLAEWKAKPAQAGNPFLAPWANRIDQNAFFFGGKKYLLNTDLGNFRLDGNKKPIHGLLVYAADWRITTLWADQKGAQVTSRLEFWKNPDWMAQFPFAHAIEMTYLLRDGALEVRTTIENLATGPMPVSIGYHTYYQVPDAPRDQWMVHLPARDHYVLSNELIPTGETRPVKFANPLPLAGTQLDDVFGDLVRDNTGRAAWWVEGASQRITVEYGPKYTVGVVYAPRGRNFICFEPMTGPTNVFNLAHQGISKELQTVRAGGQWSESFWIRPSGF